MAPSNPKRPGRPPGGPGSSRSGAPKRDPRQSPRRQDLELPFDDVEPLRADDPSPQRVPQYPSNGRRAVEILRDEPDLDDESTSALPKPGRYRTPVELDEELPPSYASDDMAEPGFSPASLYVERGPGAGQLSPVKQGVLIVGRSSSATVRLQHPSISRRHAQVTRRGERFFVKDLGSQNGTYVNQVRIDREAEIFAGDELVIGTSQLRLRGPAGAQTSSTVTRSPRPSAAAVPASHVTGIAIASGAVGIGLASVIIFAFFKFSGPSYEQVPPAAVTQTVLPPTLPPPVPNHVPAAVQSAADKVTESAPPEDSAATPEERKVSAAPRPAPVRKEVARAQGPAAEPAPAPTGRIDPMIVARYEKGDVAAAIDLARKKNQSALVTQLVKFQTTLEDGVKALNRKDDAAALRLLTFALEQDEAIGGGWSKYNADIRRHLSTAHTLAGVRQAKEGDADAARVSFGRALRFDSKNPTAKAELAKLPAPGTKAKAIDAAFGD